MDDRKVEAFDVLLKKDDADMKPSPFLLSERHILDRPPPSAHLKAGVVGRKTRKAFHIINSFPSAARRKQTEGLFGVPWDSSPRRRFFQAHLAGIVDGDPGKRHLSLLLSL